ncbi:unnamed protein product [Blepharisma stoltei]|uniref:Uncharacterized protein n=1 Tax=Blepharisma stoltei TaxID=1481888 RepID=A0AAU9IRI9_9CILI|nr:unnamed protein product [Blepharisma stoltei]
MSEEEIIPFVSNFPEMLVAKLWDDPEPIKIIGPLVAEAFKSLDLAMHEEDSKPRAIISELLLHTYVFGKKQMTLTDSQISVLMHIVFDIIKRPAISSDFNIEKDRDYLRNSLVPHCSGYSPVFNLLELQKILDYLDLTYFAHYNMLKFLFTIKRDQKNIVIQPDIDLPLPKPAHSEGVLRVIKPPEKSEEIPEGAEENKETKESLKDKLLNSLDESVRVKLLEKINEAKENMIKQVEQRDKNLKQKLEEIEKEMKKKRRK